MRRLALGVLFFVGCGPSSERVNEQSPGADQERTPVGVRLGDLTWIEAEERFGPETIIVIPLGAAAKEHGPHLRLDNDLVLAEYFAGRVLQEADIVLAPTLPYHYYPAFGEYPGSTSLELETARDLVVDVVRSLARHGPRRFYVLNTGVSTVKALEPAAAQLREGGIELRYTDLLAALGPVEAEISEQERGTHADEIETSMLLYIAPERVDMSKAVRETSPKGISGLTRDPANTRSTLSHTGVWGDATLATREKGEKVCEALVAAALSDIEMLREAPVPLSRADGQEP